jgi:hypothetical protein
VCERGLLSLPVKHCAVDFPIYGQVRSLVRKLFRKLLIVIDAQPRRVARMQVAAVKGLGVREDFIGFSRVPHVFLNSEIVHRNIEVQRRGHGNGGQICRTVAAGSHVVNLG